MVNMWNGIPRISLITTNNWSPQTLAIFVSSCCFWSNSESARMSREPSMPDKGVRISETFVKLQGHRNDNNK